MFDARRFGGPALSASRRSGFHIAPRDVVRRSASAQRASASIATGFSAQPGVSPRHVA